MTTIEERARVETLVIIHRQAREDGYYGREPKQASRWDAEQQKTYDEGWLRGAEMAERRRALANERS